MFCTHGRLFLIYIHELFESLARVMEVLYLEVKSFSNACMKSSF